MTRRDLPAWLPLVLLALVLGALFYRLLAGQVLFWGLPTLQFYPWRHFAFQQIKEGHLPSWNPYLGAGAPLLANYQSALFYPPNWLMLLLPDAQAMGLISLLHIIWAGIGMWLFTGVLGFTRLGRGISMLSYALSGALIGRFGSFPTLDAAAWIPWMYWVVHQVLTRRHWQDVGWLGIVFGLQLLAGHAQTTWYSLIGIGLYGAWQAAWGMPGSHPRQRLAALVMVGAGLLLGAAVAAVQLVPTLEYFKESQRSGGLDYKTITNLSYSPFRLITFLSPHFYGTPADGSYITKGIYFEDTTYIGFIPFISAIAAVAGWPRRRRTVPAFQTVPYWLALALAALLVATGYYGPFFTFLYEHVPTFDFFREPVRWLILTVFSFSVLAGIGVQNWKSGKWAAFWSRLAAAGGAGMVVVALVSRQFIQVDSKNLDVLTLGFMVLGCWITGAALLTLVHPDRSTGNSHLLWQTAVLSFVAVDLGWASTGLNPTVPADFYRPSVASPSEGRLYWSADYEQSVKFDRFFVLPDYRPARQQWREVRGSLLPDLNMLDGVSTLNNFDPLLPRYHRRYVELVEALGEKAAGLLRAAGVNWVYSETPPAGWQGTAPLFTSDQPTPPIWLVPQARWADSDQAVENALRDPDWNPEQTVILAGKPPQAVEASAVSVNGTVTVLESRPDQVRCRVQTDTAAYLVFSTTWYPGWSASVNGEKTKLHRADLAFQAIAVPPGESEVTLAYHLNRWRLGVGVTIAAILAAAGLILFGRRR